MVLSLWKQLADVVKTKDLHGLAAKHSFYGDKTQPDSFTLDALGFVWCNENSYL